jgi:ATP-dependent Clp protease ATP-binding subunit ClpA
MISKELRNIFAQAVGYAKSSKHEYLTVEHIFLMLIHDQAIENLFIDLGVDTDNLFDDLKFYIDENTPKFPAQVDVEEEPIETLSLASTIEYMIAHSQSSGKQNANVEDMFVAILKDEKSYASFLLRKLGIQRVDILEEISHKDLDDEDNQNNDADNEAKVLEKNSTELVHVAKKNEIDPVIGRDKEISRVIEILSRRKKNNPILSW